MATKKDWVALLEKILKQIDGMKPKDRLGYVSAISYLNNTIINSCSGWLQWLTSPQIMSDFSEDELKELFILFKKVAKEFVKADLNWTQKKRKQQEKVTVPQSLSYVR